MSNNDDIQWLESYLRYGYDPEAQRFEDNNMVYFQTNPYFALPPPSQMSHPSPGAGHARLQPPYPQSRPLAERSNVRPTPANSSSAPAPSSALSRPAQAPPRYTHSSNGAPPPVSRTQSPQHRFALVKGPEAYQNLAQQALCHSQRAPSPQAQRPSHSDPPSTTVAAAAAPPPSKTAPRQPQTTGSPQLLNPTSAQPHDSAPPSAPHAGRAWTVIADGNRTASSSATGSAPRPTSKTVPPESQKAVYPQASQPVPSSVVYPALLQNPPAHQHTSGSRETPPAGSYNAPFQPMPQGPPTYQYSGAVNHASPAGTDAGSSQSVPHNFSTSQYTGGPNQNPSAGPHQTPSHGMPHMPQSGHTPVSAPAPDPGFVPAPLQAVLQKQQINVFGEQEPGPAAKRRRVTDPKTPKQPASFVATDAGHPSIPAGGLSVYSYAPTTTTGPRAKDHLKHRADIVKPINADDAARKLFYDPKTIARDVLIASGRHPTEDPLNHHLFRLRDAFSHVDNGSDLTTFRWDLVDSHEARDQGPVGQEPAPRPPPQIFPSAPVPPAPAHFPQTLPPHPQPQAQISKPTSTLEIPVPAPSPQVQLTAKTSVPPSLQQAYTPPPSAQPQPQSQPKTPSSTMVGKRGPGRPPGSGNKPKQPVVTVSQVPYQVFCCQWTNCRGELHNLEGLKKHIFKVHVSQQLTCGWSGCTHLDPMPAAQLFKHVKTNHLGSIAWRLGDGPSVPKPGDKTTETGLSTIPQTGRPGTDDMLIFPASGSSIRSYHRVHGNTTQQQKAQEILKAVQRLKEQIGVGLDPGGCELANFVRNERHSTDENVYEVVV
ncbi:putative C2H2 finger domain protein [Aspergillus saccharolyticus JOP 1030-1]|uniref:C2H2-type domain-containing protein n=1 Tax=Aspergillus saccharolyticus JOP 1030-1 TaxID=1450539 RepID=A0A318ZPT4_9EURO|nr:hypothetical protein BP01DRAFT_420472 [Aspergillus saccharolyticus JOP 1030-1]PYH49536.1 hypothetical protein BP01DRAFT_420472 [Aspergillus saccharolyticus JOP 1030-1]